MTALVVNLFAGPGTGKSTMAAGLFYKLKTAGITCELVGEYAKDIFYEGDTQKIADQIYVFAKQQRRVLRLADKVDVVICDSPTILGLAYMPDHYPPCFAQLVKWQFDQYRNMNIFLERKKAFNPKGRFHNEQQSKQKDVEIQELLHSNSIEYSTVPGNDEGLEQVFKSIMLDDRLLDKQLMEYKLGRRV